MRILYYSDNTSGHNRRFLAKLAVTNHEVWFCDSSRSERPAGWLPAGIREFEPALTLRPDSDPAAARGALPEVERMLAAVNPDVVHAGPVQKCGYPVALAGFHPLLLASWGSDLLLGPQRDASWMEATRVALDGADALFVDNTAVLNAARRFVDFADDRVLNFPWGVELDRFGPPDESINRGGARFEPDAFVFICTRSWEPLYGIDVVLDAFRAVREKHSGARLVLLGAGSMDVRIRAFVAEHGLEGVIHMPGASPPDAVAGWFRRADAYVSAAHSDGTSVSLLEAMATGLPVIVTDNASNREWVSPRTNGWLASDVPGFSEAMQEACELSTERRQEMARASRRLVEERADWDANFPRLLAMYEQLLAHSRAGGGRG